MTLLEFIGIVIVVLLVIPLYVFMISKISAMGFASGILAFMKHYITNQSTKESTDGEEDKVGEAEDREEGKLSGQGSGERSPTESEGG